MKNTIIFKDNETINYLRETLDDVCNILNENHKKVLAFNPNLSEKITFYHSFFVVGGDNREIVDKSYNELKDTIKAKSPFYTESMVQEYYNKLNDYLHYNEYRKSGEFYIKQACNYDDEERLRELETKNIKHINRGISGKVNLGFYDKLHLSEYFITFSDNKFIINEDNFNVFVASRTYYTSNKNQNRALELLQNINNEFNELQKLNPDINKNLFSNVTCSLITDNNLVNRIYEIK